MSAEKCSDEAFPMWVALPLALMLIAGTILFLLMAVAFYREYIR